MTSKGGAAGSASERVLFFGEKGEGWIPDFRCVQVGRESRASLGWSLFVHTEPRRLRLKS